MPDELPQLAQLHQSVSDTRQTTEDARPLLLISLCLLALVVGIVTGLGAVVFRALIACVHNLLFLGHWSFYYDFSVFTPPSPWGPWVILVPVIGAVGVTFIVNNFAPEAKGHGVPEVMDAIYYNRGVIRPVVAVAKSLASALAIGSGAAVGREGPIIQIGSALGSTFGQVIRMSMGQRIILVAAGAGAGIAATFNTPIGGVLFATELMLPEISVNTFLPVAIATGTATFIGRLFFGAQPAFSVPSDLAAAARGAEQCPYSAAVCRTRRRGRRGRGGVRPQPALGGRRVRQNTRPLPAACAGDAAGRRADLRADALGRALLRRRCRLRDDPGDPHGPACRRRFPAAALCLQAGRHLGEPGLRLVGRHLLAVAVHGGDPRRRLRRRWRRRSCPVCRSACRPSPWWAWARWWEAAPARR